MERTRHARNVHREVIAVAQAKTKTHAHLRRRLLTIFLATAFFSVLCTLIVYLVEHGNRHTEIHDLFDAFLFSTSQLLTGSSVANPATDAGKVLELVFDIWAITVVATLAGSFGAFFHQRSRELDRAESAVEHEVEELRSRI